MPGGFFLRKLDGVYGSVVIPKIGLTIATMTSWSLSRREDAPPESGEWNLRAVFSYLNEFAWNSPDWGKDIQLTVGNQRTGKILRLIPAEGGRTVLDGKSLMIEGAHLVNAEGQ